MNKHLLNYRGARVIAICVATSPLSAIADNTAKLRNTSTKPSASQSNTAIEEVVVQGHPLSSDGLAQPVIIIDDAELQGRKAASIGETLQGLPSMSSTSFGQAVGRPVIRGLAGARVKVLQDRIDTLDVSVTSPDHAATIDAFTAESIEVLMGPSTLLYGSGALGGVVNVNSGRLLSALPEETRVGIEARGANNADRRTAAGHIDTGLGNVALHLDGFYRDADAYDIPGFAESARQRALEEEEHEHEEEHEDEHSEEEAQGTLPGSELETFGGAAGLSYIGDTHFLGVSLSSYRAKYGLPGHSHDHAEEHGEEEHEEEEHDEAHEEEEGNPILDLEQTRVDLEWGQQDPLAGIKSLNLRVGYNDYEHIEFEPDGGLGTTFKSEAYEARLEFVHQECGGLEGSFGLQASDQEFSALGEEAFVDPVDTQALGVFYVAQTTLGNLGIEGGLRAERVEHKSRSGDARDFTAVSASLGLIQPISETLTVSSQFDLSSRAPIAIELFANGAHLATQSFELGDPDLDEERAANASLRLDYQKDRWLVAVNAFYTQFDGFIFEAATGETRDELPVLQWRQEDASLYGADVTLSWEALLWNQGKLTLHATADTVRAQLDKGDNRNLPRIPPSRWSLGAALNWSQLTAAFSYSRSETQDITAPLELISNAYNDLRVQLSYAIGYGKSETELFLNAYNLTDDEQRLHTSFIKDLAPQPGRTVELGFRLRY